MDKQAQSSRGGAPLQHGYIALCFGIFLRAAEIQPVRLEHKPFLRYDDALSGVGLFHIQRIAGIHQQLVMQRKVIAVGVNALWVIRLDDDIRADVFLDRPAG